MGSAKDNSDDAWESSGLPRNIWEAPQLLGLARAYWETLVVGIWPGADLIKTLGTAIQRYVGGSFLAEPVFKPLMEPG